MRRPKPASTLRAANTVTSAPLPSARLVKVKAAIAIYSDMRKTSTSATSATASLCAR